MLNIPRALATVLVVSAIATPMCARADNDAALQLIVSGGPWHYRSIPCTDATVTAVGPRLQTLGQTVFTPQDFEQSGVSVIFAFSSPWNFLGRLAPTKEGVVHYQGTLGNDIMQSERAGDRVQVCLAGFPLPGYYAPMQRVTCDPDRDQRGFIFRVYDYRQHAAYVGPNSEHGCGGA